MQVHKAYCQQLPCLISECEVQLYLQALCGRSCSTQDALSNDNVSEAGQCKAQHRSEACYLRLLANMFRGAGDAQAGADLKGKLQEDLGNLRQHCSHVSKV